MPRKSPSKPNIKANTFTEQNAKNEKAFKKTEEYLKAAKLLSDEIIYSAQLFQRIQQHTEYEFDIATITKIWKKYAQDVNSKHETVIDFIEDADAISQFIKHTKNKINDINKFNNERTKLISSEQDCTELNEDLKVLTHIHNIHIRKNSGFPYGLTPIHSSNIFEDFKTAVSKYSKGSDVKTCFRSIGCINELNTQSFSYQSYHESVRAATLAPIRYFKKYINGVNDAYEAILALDKRKNNDDTENTLNIVKVGQKIVTTFGSNQYDTKKAMPDETALIEKDNGASMLAPMNWFSSTKKQDEGKQKVIKQEEKTVVTTSKKETPNSKELASQNDGKSTMSVDSTDFSDSIDASMQDGADDFYAQAKASCFNKAIKEVKKYSNCLIRPKSEMGGTFGCLRYKYKADDLVELCTETYPFATNDKVEILITEEMKKAQKVEYDDQENILATDDDTSLFDLASRVLELSDTKLIAASPTKISCEGGKCVELPQPGQIDTPTTEDL